MNSFERWLRQPTTINGIGALVGVAAGVAAHVLTGQTSAAVGAGAVAAAVVHLLVADNTAEARDVQALVRDAVAAVVQKRVAEALPGLAGDVAKALADAAAPAVKV